MSNPIPAPAHVVADPKRPYKAYAGMFVALLGLIWANLEGRDSLDNMTMMEWLSIIIPALLTFGTVYKVTNPKILDVDAVADDRGAAEPGFVLIVLGLVLAVLALLVADVAFLLWVGVVIAVVGVVLLVAGRS